MPNRIGVLYVYVCVSEKSKAPAFGEIKLLPLIKQLLVIHAGPTEAEH